MRRIVLLAATLAMAVLVPMQFQTLSAPGTLPAGVARSGLTVVAPIGRVAAVSGFEWLSPIQAARYRVTVFRGVAAVHSGETTETRLPVPPTLTLDRGVEYIWRVDALDAGGSVRLASPPFRFVVR